MPESNLSHITNILDNYELSIFDDLTRILVLLVYIIYFLLVAWLKPFRTRNYLYLHHVNLIAFLFSIHLVAYLRTRSSPIDYIDLLPPSVCYASELAWSTSKYLRMYSLLLLAIYRFMAVFKIEFYKKLNKKPFNLFSVIILVWFLSLGFSLTLKYGLGTRPAGTFCRDGYSDPERRYVSVIYYSISIMLNNVLPK